MMAAKARRAQISARSYGAFMESIRKWLFVRIDFMNQKIEQNLDILMIRWLIVRRMAHVFLVD